MPEIISLSENVWSRIAAGEVVERPASVVKELVENSLDAHARRIRVKLFDGGRLRIITEDDGKGISFDDLPLALMYHATSKISQLEDLERINTLGYRGEALASLVAVADVEIRSRHVKSEHGGLIRTHNGKIIEHVKINNSQGTHVKVENLFITLPARRKFLKSASGELRRAAVFLREYAVCNPDIAFYLEHDGKEIFSTDGTGDKELVLSKLWGNGTQIQNVNISTGHLKLECWFQLRAGISSGRNDLISFVNGRAVNDPVIKNAVSQAARDLTGNWALFFELEPSLIDVNIHPAKSEIRFRYPSEVYEAVRKVSVNLGSPMVMPEIINTPAKSSGWKFHDTPRKNYTPAKSYEPAQNIIPDLHDNKPQIIYMGQNSGGYLIYDTEQGIVIMDPHAAHERVNYERIKSNAAKSSHVQKLLMPVLLHPTLALESHEYEHELREAGFEFTNTTKGIELNAVPAISDNEFEPEALLRASLNALKSNHSGKTLDILWRTWAIMACKASVKLTTEISQIEALNLWHELHECEQPYVCPHGRPTLIEIKNDDMLKRFGRE